MGLYFLPTNPAHVRIIEPNQANMAAFLKHMLASNLACTWFHASAGMLRKSPLAGSMLMHGEARQSRCEVSRLNFYPSAPCMWLRS